jgi:antitoxin ParD1/3/4
MAVQKLSVSLPKPLAKFVDAYRKKRGIRSRSRVFAEALTLLRNQDLEAAYRDASRELDPAWESTVADGLEDEAW